MIKKTPPHIEECKIDETEISKSLELEKKYYGGPDAIRNPDDASGARIEVYRYAQHRNTNDKALANQSKPASKEVIDCGGPDEIRTHDPRRVNKAVDGDFEKHLLECQGQEPPYATEILQPVLLNDMWAHHQESFKDWLYARSISERTKKDYYRSLVKFFDTTIVHKPQEFRTRNLGDKAERGLRNLLNYFEEEDIDDIANYSIEKWRRFIKIKQSGVVEIYVTDEEIQEAYAACAENVKPILKLLIYSGNRLSHIHAMLENFDEKKIVVDGDIAHYPTSSFSSGTKRTFQIFFPTLFIPELKSFNNLYSYDSLLKKTKHGRVSSKTIRKWHLNLMVAEGVTESIADFIQGRAPVTVGSAHYLNKVKRAKEEYRRIVGKFVI